MQHILIERWSRGQSWLHDRDPRIKIVVLLAYLIALGLVRLFTVTAFPIPPEHKFNSMPAATRRS